MNRKHISSNDNENSYEPHPYLIKASVRELYMREKHCFTYEDIMKEWGLNDPSQVGKYIRGDDPATKDIVRKVIQLCDGNINEVIEFRSEDHGTRPTMHTNAMINVKKLEFLPDFIRSKAENAKTMISWASILPCSWENKEFMRQHHKSLFNSIVTDMTVEEAETAVDAYNAYGDRANARFDTQERIKSYSFDGIMYEADLRDIANPASIEYFMCTREARLSTINRLILFMKNSDDYNSHLWLIDEQSRAKFIKEHHRWHPKKMLWDSLIVLRDADEKPLAVFCREMPNMMTQMSADERDLLVYNNRIIQAQNAANLDIDYTIKVLEDVGKEITSTKMGSYPGDINYVPTY